ncbi:MAG: FecR family protein [Pseudomonadota bacterium]
MLEPAPAQAQIPPGCSVTELTGPARLAYACAGGVLIEAEAAAAMGFAAPGALSLEAGAVLIEIPEGHAFQVRTPHAVAAVRGTLYAVETQEDVTSVFVLEGTVAARAVEAGAPTVLLGAGEGIDLHAGAPASAATWGEARSQALLARFGR